MCKIEADYIISDFLKCLRLCCCFFLQKQKWHSESFVSFLVLCCGWWCCCGCFLFVGLFVKDSRQLGWSVRPWVRNASPSLKWLRFFRRPWVLHHWQRKDWGRQVSLSFLGLSWEWSASSFSAGSWTERRNRRHLSFSNMKSVSIKKTIRMQTHVTA